MTVIPPIVASWQPITGAESLHEDADRATSATGATVAVDAKQGSPPEELLRLALGPARVTITAPTRS